MVMEKLFLSSKLIAFSPLFFFATVMTSLSAIRLMVGKVCKIALKKKSYPTQPKNSNFTSNSKKQNFTRDAYLQIHLNMYWLIWGSWGYLSEAEYAKQRMVKPSLECRQYHMLALALVQTNKHLENLQWYPGRSDRKESVVNIYGSLLFYNSGIFIATSV